MDIIESVFSGIDFSAPIVQIIAIIFIIVLIVVILLIFLLLKHFIPKSKMKDLKTVESAIRRLKLLMVFDKIILIICIAILVALLLLHFLSTIDVFQKPIIWILLIDASIAPIFLIAVFGHRGTSNNKRKLDELYGLKRNIENK